MNNNEAILELDDERPNNSFEFWGYDLSEVYYADNMMVPPHWHNYIEILYTEAEGRLCINDMEYKMNPGDIFIINPGHVHRTYRDSGSGHTIHYLFDLSMLKLGSQNKYDKLIDDVLCQNRKMRERVDVGSELYGEILPSVLTLRKWCETEIPIGHDSCEVMSQLFHIMASFLKFGVFEVVNSGSVYEVQYIEKSMRYIDAQFSENIKVEDIAKNLNISVTYLYRLFRDYVGTTPVKYINSVRLHAAYEYLSKGMNVTETANAVGIPNISYFIKLFRTATGETPVKWLRSRREQK